MAVVQRRYINHVAIRVCSSQDNGAPPKPEASYIGLRASVLSRVCSGELAHLALPLHLRAWRGALLAVVAGVVFPVVMRKHNTHGHVATADLVSGALAPPAREQSTVYQLVGFSPILRTCTEDAGAGVDGRARVGSKEVGGRGAEWRGTEWRGAERGVAPGGVAPASAGAAGSAASGGAALAPGMGSGSGVVEAVVRAFFAGWGGGALGSFAAALCFALLSEQPRANDNSRADVFREAHENETRGFTVAQRTAEP